jgi:hypothetical protein
VLVHPSGHFLIARSHGEHGAVELLPLTTNRTQSKFSIEYWVLFSLKPIRSIKVGKCSISFRLEDGIYMQKSAELSVRDAFFFLQRVCCWISKDRKVVHFELVLRLE